MKGIVFMTVVSQNVFSPSWNETDDFIEEPRPGLVSGLLERKPSGMFVYDRCGRLVNDDLKMLSPLPSDTTHAWLVPRRDQSMKSIIINVNR